MCSMVSTISAVVAQASYRTAFEWGEQGVHALAANAQVVVIVDVLSFSTAVDVAVARGARVFPYRVRDASAAAYAASVQAELAVPRQQMSDQQPYSLSPESLQRLRAGQRVVLPSPNGATLALEAAAAGAQVLAGC